MAALLDEANEAHSSARPRTSARWASPHERARRRAPRIDSMTHFYGLFESMLRRPQRPAVPVDTTTTTSSTASARSRGSGTRSTRAAAKWNALIDELLERRFILDPTMTIYSAGRDVMRARNADWHEKYTLPSLWDFFQPSREAHGSYWFDWTTWDEVAWKLLPGVDGVPRTTTRTRGGRVTVGSDSGFIYQLYGFGYVLELEMLQEAGFHPLEVIRAATCTAPRSCTSRRANGSTAASSARACSPTSWWSTRTRSPTSRCSTAPAR
jgi:hypothetical protein